MCVCLDWFLQASVYACMCVYSEVQPHACVLCLQAFVVCLYACMCIVPARIHVFTYMFACLHSCMSGYNYQYTCMYGARFAENGALLYSVVSVLSAICPRLEKTAVRIIWWSAFRCGAPRRAHRCISRLQKSPRNLTSALSLGVNTGHVKSTRGGHRSRDDLLLRRRLEERRRKVDERSIRM